MRRCLMLIALISTLCATFLDPLGSQGSHLHAQEDKPQVYTSELLGFSFQYPSQWDVKEQAATQTVITATKTDLQAVTDGKAPDGVLISISITSFRQVGAQTPAQFADVLAKVANSGQAASTPIQIGGADGLVVEVENIPQQITTRTAILSIGQRRIAIIRGVATLDGWKKNGAQDFAALTGTIGFFKPVSTVGLDSVGIPLWNLTSPHPDLHDIALSPDGATITVTTGTQGLWQAGANGVALPNQPVPHPEISNYAGIMQLRDGRFYIADPTNHAIWEINTDDKIRRFAGGKVGTARGTFGETSPSGFAFGSQGTLFVMDENSAGTRIQVFNRGGSALTFFDLKFLFGDNIVSPLISTDGQGNIYVIGANTNGVILLNAAGQLIRKNIGATALGGALPLAMTIDRFANIYIATDEQGILKLNNDGDLVGVIGEPYDQSAPPKLGQLGKPVGLVIQSDGSLMYVADAGAFPQIVAFSLDGNKEVNLTAGTQTGEIIYGQSLKGEITATTFNYVYTFQGRAGDVITITMQHDADSKLDTFVELINLDRTRLRANDDHGETDDPTLDVTDSQIKNVTLPFNGTYSIRATRFGRETSSSTGKFTLTLQVND